MARYNPREPWLALTTSVCKSFHYCANPEPGVAIISDAELSDANLQHKLNQRASQERALGSTQGLWPSHIQGCFAYRRYVIIGR